MPEFVGLRRRAFRIVLTSNDERWGLHVFNKTNGRTFLVNGRIIINRCAEKRDHPLTDQVLAIVTLPIRDASASYSGVETIGLRNGPHGHEAAVTPPSHAETRRIDWIFFRDQVDAGHRVAQIAAAKIFHVCAGKIFACAVTAAGVGKKDVITTYRK